MSSAHDFGQNQWLVDDMYERFKKDPQSVDQSWRDFFAAEGFTGAGNAAPADGDLKAATAQNVTQGQPTKPAPIAGQEPATQRVSQPTHRSAGSAAPSLADDQRRQRRAERRQQMRELAAKAREKSGRPSPLSREVTLPAAVERVLKGVEKTIAKNMDVSLEIPTATSVRDMPARLLFENRTNINTQLKQTTGGKVSFTHLIGYALIQAVKLHPDMNNYYDVVDGKPTLITPEHINLGLAIDMVGKNGVRSLVVAAIKHTETMDFREFVAAYEDIVKRAREGKLTMDDFQGVTISLTNPGGIGTRHSVPRLTKGQGAIIGVGSMDYPAEFAGASEERLAKIGVGKLVTITSTYDHRIIQGAESGDFLRTLSNLLIDDLFWDDIFHAMGNPYQPVRWAQDASNEGIDKNARVLQLIGSFRNRGHLIANTDPLQFTQAGNVRPGHKTPSIPDLEIENHGLTLWDYDRSFSVAGLGGKERMTLREVLATLYNSYCRKVGFEFNHILDNEERTWLRERIEAGQPKPTVAQQKYVLQKLNAAEAFENFLQTKYVGQKRFSLEGAEALIPMMDAVIDTAAEHQLDEVVIGMPHRGRLNVLANIVGKPLDQIFNEFEGNSASSSGGSGDVKYHLGAVGKHIQMFGDNEITVSLTANPSHLEAVNPVLEGLVRAKQDILDLGEDGYTVMPLLLHGDAAFAGLGIVQETMNLSLLRGYKTGGTVHIVVNNQIGFTTAPENSRSTEYATDIAKAFGVPVFHVNGDDPEACVWVSQLAVDYREQFGKDVVIDLICYRRRGHNEADDPSMTQPAMYDLIADKDTVRAKYTTELIGRGDLSEAEAEAALRDFHDQMEGVFNEVREIEKSPNLVQSEITHSQQLATGLDTTIDEATLAEIGDKFIQAPADFTYHHRVKPVAERRAKMAHEGDIDWGFAELVAFGSVAMEGRIVRLAGEDSRRGTFTQRHAVMIDPETSGEFSPLAELAKEHGGKFMVYDSALTEYAGMGFEYGYSVGNTDALVAWEAQFGDFANGAQTILDEYISSGEAKWNQLSRVALLLPHGYEGMGPDHSSARIERYLQMVAEGSMTIAQPTEPANYFHLLRRHALSEMIRPLVVFTPKSMLRLKQAVSPVSEFTSGKFRSVIDDPMFFTKDGAAVAGADPEKVTKILLTSGKFYWDLEKRRAKEKREDLAIVRVEMLAPIPFNRLKESFSRYPNATEVRWCQEEPANQGPWPYLKLHLETLVPGMPPFTLSSRRAMSSTATGIAKVHQAEAKALLDQIFD